MKPAKTPEIRARELYRLVNGEEWGNHFPTMSHESKRGWLKLGKFVLSLERKWSKAKKDSKYHE